MIWVARYSDGSYLAEFDEKGEHLFKEIQQDKLESFELITEFGRTFQVKINPNRKLVFFRRHFAKLDGSHDQHYFIGWQENFHDSLVTRLIEIKPNGDVELHDNR